MPLLDFGNIVRSGRHTPALAVRALRLSIVVELETHMPSRQRLITAVLVISATMVGIGASQVARSVGERTRSSGHVVVATVAAVEPRYGSNEFGDQLIVSDVVLQVDETLKGDAVARMSMQLEGGTVGDMTLTVSDLPTLRAGERGVFFLARNRAGRFVPHLRGQSILKLDDRQMVRGTSVPLDDIRHQVHAAR